MRIMRARELSPIWIRVLVWVILALVAVASVWVIDRRAVIVMGRDELGRAGWGAMEAGKSASSRVAADPRLP